MLVVRPDAPFRTVEIKQVLPEFEIRNWFGIAGPGNLPPAIVARWTDALRRVGADPAFQRRMTENGMEVLKCASSKV
ncbi:hypothetical protein [Falsiroseomonas sp.]|uniref:hypothetical protein n=1 Tax=Falsiroseomonas sp. TaxID=2870721 RepID=UPI00356635CD